MERSTDLLDKPVFLDEGRELLYERVRAVPDLQKMDLVALCAMDPFARTTMLAMAKSASAHAASAVIAIGKYGGKIVGYDKKGQPIYLDEGKQDVNVHSQGDALSENSQALQHFPKPVLHFLDQFTADHVHAAATPNPAMDGVYNVDLKGPASAVEHAVAKAHAYQDHGIVVSKTTRPLPGGAGQRLAVKVVAAPKPEFIEYTDPKVSPEPVAPAPPVSKPAAVTTPGWKAMHHVPLFAGGTRVVDSDGNAGVFVPIEDELVAARDRIASGIAALLMGLGKENKPLVSEYEQTIEVDGVQGALKTLPDGWKTGLPMKKLNQRQTSQLVQHMVVDWLLGASSPTDTFGLDVEGNVTALDKRTATFDEVAPMGSGPVYEQLLQGIASGKLTFKPDTGAMKMFYAGLKYLDSTKLGNAGLPISLAANVIGRAKHAEKHFKALLAQAAADTQATAPAGVPAGAKILPGYEVVDHTTLKSAVDHMKSQDKGLMFATVSNVAYSQQSYPYGSNVVSGRVVGRLRNDPLTYIVADQKGERHYVSRQTLLNADAQGKVVRYTGNALYADLPAIAVVVKPPAALKAKLDAGMKVKIGSAGSCKHLIEKLKDHGVASLIVGGTVRDAIDGVPVKDVDITTTTSYAANLQFAQKYSNTPMTKQGTVKIKGGEGFDIATMRGRHFNATMYGDTNATHGHLADESVSVADDLVNRDFACNAMYYDHENEVIIDSTGRGVVDAQNQILHPSIDDFDLWLHANGPRNFARMFKFIGRGYKLSPELRDLAEQHFLKQMSRPDGWYQATTAHSSAAEKYSKNGVYEKWQAQREVMKAYVNANFKNEAVRTKMHQLIMSA